MTERPAPPQRIAELERLVGKQQALIDFFEHALQRVEAKTAGKLNRDYIGFVFQSFYLIRRGPRSHSARARTNRITLLTVEEMCRETGLSRAGSYRRWHKRSPSQEETELRERMQTLALAHRTYGYRRITALLRREGLLVNHKRGLRLLREDNLLALRKKRFIATTDSRHRWRAWPNLARWMRPDGPQPIVGRRHSPIYVCKANSAVWR